MFINVVKVMKTIVKMIQILVNNIIFPPINNHVLD